MHVYSSKHILGPFISVRKRCGRCEEPLSHMKHRLSKCPCTDSYPGPLKMAVKHGIYLLLSPQLPAARGSGIQISEAWILQPCRRREAIKTSPGLLRAGFLLSVNSIHFGKGSKKYNSCKQTAGWRKSKRERIDLYPHIVLSKTDTLL